MKIGLMDAKGMNESQIRLSGCPIKGYFRVKNALIVPFIGNKASPGLLSDPPGRSGGGGGAFRGVPVVLE